MHISSTQISAAELIITPRNTIYHLDLAPGEIADTILTVGDPGRVSQVSKYFDEITHKAQHREFVTHTGRIGNKRLTVLSTGIGPDNIDIVFNELDALANIDFETKLVRDTHKQLDIIRLGTSGALQADIPADSIVISTHGLGLDNLMHFYEAQPDLEEQEIIDSFNRHTGAIGNGNVVPYIYSGSSQLLQYFDNSFFRGITVTCPGFYGPQGRKLRLSPANPYLIDSLTGFSHDKYRITNFEMETSAMYGLAKLMGHRSLSISAIIANRIAGAFSKDYASAVDRMIKASLEVIVDNVK